MGIITKNKAKAMAQDPKTCIYTHPAQFDVTVDQAIRQAARAGGFTVMVVVIPCSWGDPLPTGLGVSLKQKLKELHYQVTLDSSIPDEIALTISWE